ncbi:ATP/GTP-binding protein [Streptacidiphilus pinicola]|uniref:ATP/GTP-binding protein n=1 Tax=Streptacidiphilus pinicola TaxID=2219663 RepID=A0A2X0JUP1_9ACTN|nr:NUDIX domain-containing protein [Streptacidiphilus pinicola]RAG80625.1 ATP/GTP-binding protein [Streptacidiphilus pinicola]
MIVWLNGAFGAGKTTTVRELQRLIPGSHVFDPEDVGALLRCRLLPAASLDGLTDYQDLVAWRRLVPDTLAALHAQLGEDTPLLVPMALHRQDYRDEIFGALAARRLDVHHVLLHAEESILRKRIDADETEHGARGWRLSHLDAYAAALPWLRADAAVVDTADLTPRQTAECVADLIRTGACRVPIVQDAVATGDTVAAAVLLFDEADRVLLVDPVYKPGWEFPGGVVETGEAPSAAAVREAAEELGVTLRADDLRLLVVDWEPRRGPRSGGLRLVFDGGSLAPAQQAALALPPAELRSWRFVPPEEWDAHLAPNKASRLRAALAARRAGHVAYLEAGHPA